MRVAPPYVRAAGRFEAQLSVLTGAGNMGNYNMHAVAKVVHGGKAYEVPVLTGNALKHWHSVYLAEVYQDLGGKQLNEFCMKGVGLRGKNLGGDDASSEAEAIKDLCNDLHGFLLPDKQIKRDSLVRVSFAVPVLEEKNLEAASKFAVVHNRVDPFKRTQQVKSKEEQEGTEMMVFKQEYSSAVYGFAVAMDLGLSGVPLYQEGKSDVDDKERELRIKSALVALLRLFNGVGSKQARALPIARLRELVIAISDSPIPNLVHGAYPDYVARSAELLTAYLRAVGKKGVVLCYGVDCPRSNDVLECKKADTLDALFQEVLGRALPGGQPARR
ncbi:type I-A CRISPR-associated protein Cas7/Csa2 [Pyrobaculum neutrophilum]|uniref:type I-A CRISPR-associated protein Cas7/Csa2 n=1 Tax=Pyrobaculum neutrophilum TaxID=70771 RepID=UPI0011E5829F|nr:type I-A CRISPR-associated protein Cas7/Csa2 [Pyrobaculum neutrophilum]